MNETTTPRRRWFQYSLRTLLLVMLLVSIGMSWFAVKVQKARRQRTVVEAIKKLGGEVKFDYEYGDQLPGNSADPGWFRNLLEEDFFATVVYVSFIDSRVTDDDLESLKELTQLRGLNFCGTQVGDAGLEHLRELSHLKHLFLMNTLATDEGAAKLHQALPNCTIYH